MKNIYPFYIVFQVLKVLFIKKIRIKLPDLLFLVVLHQLLHQWISFVELHSTLSEKKDFRHKFSFLTDSLKLPQPPQWPKSTKHNKSFLSMLPQMLLGSWIGLLFYKVTGCCPANLVKQKPLTGIFQGFLLQEYSSVVHNRFLWSTFIYKTFLNKCFLL